MFCISSLTHSKASIMASFKEHFQCYCQVSDKFKSHHLYQLRDLLIVCAWVERKSCEAPSALSTAAFASICAVKLSTLRLPANQVWQMKWLHKVNTHTNIHRELLEYKPPVRGTGSTKNLPKSQTKSWAQYQKGAAAKGEKCRESGAGQKGCVVGWGCWKHGNVLQAESQRNIISNNNDSASSKMPKPKRSVAKRGKGTAPHHIASHHNVPHHVAQCRTAPHRKCMPAKWQWQHFRFRPCRRHRTVGKTLSKLKGSADRRTET